MKAMFNFLRKKIGIIGFGNMGSAIADGIKDKHAVCVFDKDKNKINALKNITVAGNPVELVRQSEIIILAVKPQDFDALLSEIRGSVGNKLIVSIAAGITTGYIENILGQVRVIRVMPNLAVKVGQSTTSICRGSFATYKEMRFVLKLFRYLGIVFIFPEDMMDAATAIAGSGPGFWCDLVQGIPKKKWRNYSLENFIPQFSLAAEGVGFSKKDARKFARSTTMGTLATVEALGITPAELEKKITSKGGTTQAGLEVLHNTKSLTEAAKAAVYRSRELSKKE